MPYVSHYIYHMLLLSTVLSDVVEEADGNYKIFSRFLDNLLISSKQIETIDVFRAL